MTDHRLEPIITIEAGSGNFDRVAHMLEINAYGSLEDRRHSIPGGNQGASEEKLRERLADAMVDLNGDINVKAVASKTSPASTKCAPVRTVASDTEYISMNNIQSEVFDFSNSS
jgi:hypothetical protein